MHKNMMMGSRNNRSSNNTTFTANQWQELEQQVLIFKHMVGGIPIPPDLISNVTKGMDSSRFFPHQQSLGWGCFQMGFGRKIDPEPGRCRRTDGKKWRCSKEAHPESKYCERHMHRGKNRSRKPVEVPTALSTNTAAANAAYAHPYSLSPANYQTANSSNNPFLYPHSSSTSLKPSPPGSFLSPQSNNTTQHLFLDSGPNYSHTDRTTSYLYKDEADERSFFPEASGTVRGLKDSFTPLTMSSDNAYSQLQQRQQEKHCFVLGTDFKSAEDNEREEENQKPFHQFFGEWPQKNNREYSWLDVQENQTRDQSYATQQHSTQDLFGS